MKQELFISAITLGVMILALGNLKLPKKAPIKVRKKQKQTKR